MTGNVKLKSFVSNRDSDSIPNFKKEIQTPRQVLSGVKIKEKSKMLLSPRNFRNAKYSIDQKTTFTATTKDTPVNKMQEKYRTSKK